MGASLARTPGQVKPAKDARRADEREIRDHAFPLTRRGGRRNCRASRWHATRTGPLSGNRLPCLPCRDAAAGVAASWPRCAPRWATRHSRRPRRGAGPPGSIARWNTHSSKRDPRGRVRPRQGCSGPGQRAQHRAGRGQEAATPAAASWQGRQGRRFPRRTGPGSVQARCTAVAPPAAPG